MTDYGKYFYEEPEIADLSYVHDSAVVMGATTVHERASIWPNVTIRADINKIVIGEGSNIQDNSVVHVADDYPALIGKNVTVGHGAIIHACRIEDNCLVGMGATILDGAVIGKDSIVGANALVPKGMEVPPGSLVMGMPAKVKRDLTEDEKLFLIKSAEHYWELALKYKENSSL